MNNWKRGKLSIQLYLFTNRLEAITVRLLKKEKIMEKAKLISSIKMEVIDIYNPLTSEIETCLNNLIQRKYIFLNAE